MPDPSSPPEPPTEHVPPARQTPYGQSEPPIPPPYGQPSASRPNEHAYGQPGGDGWAGEDTPTPPRGFPATPPRGGAPVQYTAIQRVPPPHIQTPPDGFVRPPAGLPPVPRQGVRSGERPVFGWVLKAAGLVIVALVSGLIWWSLQGKGGDPGTGDPSSSRQPGVFQFTSARDEVRDTDCAAHSYDQVKDFFAETPCSQLTRSLYTTATTFGAKVLVSVTVVKMANADQAAALKRLTDTDGTGNVNDLLLEGTNVPGAPKRMHAKDGPRTEYASAQKGTSLTIVEDVYFEVGQTDTAALKNICVDAIRLDKLGN